ncbi:MULTISPECIES: ABC transporter substrate-binding protein [Paraburkholderia]|jgi:NitT/TauT family transport system substrate-binding protein|uniref:ABC transporter substrate-binding protein n=1 Tax=Paraburkholderia largidicola TaxID=3014751 RepID=A0A7I8BIT0_9BURK|nr:MULTISPECIES: ABC transporter substrate-binding protein [Paraburkholderia]BCF88577.1 ABC transporter substrate-binding protein [Paraburkholderia sp. PGU16]BEU21668.1 ABC transporter substrate-binding protein [Paraburkholderia sp. 22B1P]GJH00122.1 ABC transporter substrate-binding protein [Paraburkholderia terrae]CAG9271916.1 ABC transporter substrate-binding protein [Paraburkholderia caribensis]
MQRRSFLAGGAALAGASLVGSPLAFAQSKLETSKVSIAVGGKNLFYYLPLTIAERRNFFKDEGLDIEISDFAGGSQALKAAVGGSADVVSGAFEHTLLLQAKNQYFREFVLQGRAPQIVLAVSKKTMANYKTIADLKGKKIGVTAPGSSTSIMASFVLAKAGLTAKDVSFIGVGAGAGAIAALQSGQIDALANLDPVMTKLERSGEIRIVSDTRTLSDTRTVFGGNMPAGCLYASQSFISKNPNTTQALTNAMVRALKWLQTATGTELINTVPESYLLGDRALYLDSWQHVKEAMSPDGLMPADGPATSLKTLQAFDETIKGKPIDLSKTWTNDFVKKALATVKA